MYCAVRLQLGRRRRQFPATVASLVQQHAGSCASSSSISASRARSCSVSNCSKPSRACAAFRLRFEICRRLRELRVLGFPLHFLRGRAFNLRRQAHAPARPFPQNSDSIRCRTPRRRAMPLFQCRDPRRVLRGGLRRFFPPLTQQVSDSCARRNLLLQFHPLQFQCLDL